MAELSFAVPAGQRIAIYDDLIEDLERQLRSVGGRHDDDVRARLARLRAFRSEARQQAGAGAQAAR